VTCKAMQNEKEKVNEGKGVIEKGPEKVRSIQFEVAWKKNVSTGKKKKGYCVG